MELKIPAGWKLVPIEPSDEMLLAAGEPYAGKVDRAAGLEARRDAYRKIIAAAPEPPEPAADAAPITADAMKGLVDRGIYTKDKP